MKAKLLTAIAACTLIAACSTAYMAYNVYKENNDSQSDVIERAKQMKAEETVSTNVVGMTTSSGRVEAAQNVPLDEEIAILDAYHNYIQAMNEKDMTQYKAIISRNTTSFNYEDDIKALEEMFKKYDMQS